MLPSPVVTPLLCLGLFALLPASRSISVAEVVKEFCLSAIRPTWKGREKLFRLSS
jgi:hypothetical protein